MMKRIWSKMMRSKEYRDSYVAAHLSNTVAAQIFLLREREGWTQEQLAEKAGMRQSRISALEDPNYENFEVGTLRRLASAFDVALTIRFVPFSELLEWVTNLAPSRLEPPKFEQDRYAAQVFRVGGAQEMVGAVPTISAGDYFACRLESRLVPSEQTLLAMRPEVATQALGMNALVTQGVGCISVG